MAIAAAYVNQPVNGSAQISAANTARDGTGSLATVLAAGKTGARIDRIRAIATGTTTAGMIRYFLSLDAGTTKRLIHEQTVSAITPSGTVAVWNGDLTQVNAPWLVMAPNAILYASTHNAEVFNIIPLEAGDF